MKPESEIMDEHLVYCGIPLNEFTPEMRRSFSRSTFFKLMVLGVRWDEFKEAVKAKVKRIFQ